MGSGKITQKYIAEKLGVSVSLVSRVLSGQGEQIGISEAKIQEVLDFARANNYVPASAALALKGKKTRTLGIVVYDFHDPFFNEIIAALQEATYKYDYSLILVGFVNRTPKASDLAPLYKHFVDGIVILGSYGDLEWLGNFKSIPIVRIGRGQDPRISFAVSIDENDAARQIVRHLKSIGRKKFCYVARDISIHELRRKSAYFAAMAEDCEFVESPKKNFAANFDAGYALAEEMDKRGGVDAFVCSTDTAAMGVIKRLHELGKKVPEDYAVVGFDDIPVSANYIPSITTMRQPVDLFAANVMEYFANETEGGELNRRGQLIVRESTMGV